MSAARRPSPQKKSTPADVGASRGQVARGNQPTKRTVPANDNAGKAGLSEIVTREFHAQPVVQMTFRGRRCWLLSSIEQTLDYASGVAGDQIRGDWSDEFEQGKHYDIVAGKELSDLRSSQAKFGPGSNLPAKFALISPRARTAMVLYTEGLDLLLIKTEKPVGRELRAFLVDNVMQSLRETGRVDLNARDRSDFGALDIASAIEFRQNHINEHLEKQVGTLRFRREIDRVKVMETVRHYALRSAGVAGRPAGRWTEQEHHHALDAIDGLIRCLGALADIEIVRREFEREDTANSIRVSVNQLTLNLGHITIGGAR